MQDTVWEVWRQDDNGQKFLVASFPEPLAAQVYLKEMESRQQEQTYWIVKPPRD